MKTMEFVNKPSPVCPTQMTNNETCESTSMDKFLSLFVSFLSSGERWRLLCMLYDLAGNSKDHKNKSMVISKNVQMTKSELNAMFDFFFWLMKSSPQTVFSEGKDEWVIRLN
jgi:hypothetical protein